MMGWVYVNTTAIKRKCVYVHTYIATVNNLMISIKIAVSLITFKHNTSFIDTDMCLLSEFVGVVKGECHRWMPFELIKNYSICL